MSTTNNTTNMSTPRNNKNEELDGAPNMAESTSNAITNTLEAGEEEENLLTTPQTKEELRRWLEEYCRGEKTTANPIRGTSPW